MIQRLLARLLVGLQLVEDSLTPTSGLLLLRLIQL